MFLVYMFSVSSINFLYIPIFIIYMDLKIMFLLLTGDCNSRCSYCYMHRNKFKIGTMTFKRAKKAVDFFIKYSNKENNLTIFYIGGEPLLYFDLIKKTTIYAINKGKELNKKFKFIISSNMSLLDKEKIEFFINNNFNINVNYDGTYELVEKFKGKKIGKQIFKNIQEGIKFNLNMCLRITITPSFTNMVSMLKSLINIKAKKANFILEYGNKLPFNIDNIKRQYIKLSNEYVSYFKNFDFKSKQSPLIITPFFYDIQLDVLKQSPNLFSCAAAYDKICVIPNGKVLPCPHVEYWDDSWIMGDIEKNELNRNIQKKMGINSYENKKSDKECVNCSYFNKCQQSCLGLNYDSNKDVSIFDKSRCELEKIRIDASLNIIQKQLIEKDKNIYFLRYLLSLNQANIIHVCDI
ncbi:radical SAM protein, partial [Candidatus Woesearchaeota archaeon]|nr:radical SAM protein [Candidatus Woesearchaeota archaeon]